MRTLLFLALIVIFVSCKKDENVDADQNTFSGTPYLIAQTSDLKIITCFRTGALWDFDILKTDTSGNKIWEKHFSYDDEFHLKKLLPLDEGEFIVIINQREHIGNGINDYVRLLYFESNGNIKWMKKVDLEENIDCSDICALPENSFALCGDNINFSQFFYCKIDQNQSIN